MAPKFSIPLALSSQADINRLVREIQKLDDFFLSASVRKSGTGIQPPRITRLLSEVAEANRLNLLQEDDRASLRDHLQTVAKDAPNLHISFAAEPPPKALERILAWLRENIDPNALVVVGLQPNIAAGVVLRTPNKVFDMSMQAYLKKQEPYLVKLIDEAVRG